VTAEFCQILKFHPKQFTRKPKFEHLCNAAKEALIVKSRLPSEAVFWGSITVPAHGNICSPLAKRLFAI
jgi:hypothetical protein